MTSSTLNYKPLNEVMPQLSKLAEITKKKKRKCQNIISEIKAYQLKEAKAVDQMKIKTHALTTKILEGARSRKLGFQDLFYQFDKINYSIEALVYMKYRKFKMNTRKSKGYIHRLLRICANESRARSSSVPHETSVQPEEINIITEVSQGREDSSAKSEKPKLQKRARGRPRKQKKEKSPSPESERGKYRCPCNPSKAMKFSDYVIHQQEAHTKENISECSNARRRNVKKNPLTRNKKVVGSAKPRNQITSKKSHSCQLSSDAGSWLDSEISQFD